MATATTATNNRPHRDVVDFPPNAPVTIALKYSQGRMVSSQYGERVMFTLIDGRVMFLDPEVAGRIETLGIPRKQPGRALVDEANALVDSFAQVLERSLTLYQGRIKPEEVKALLISAYIQRQKFSSVA